jgi:hypothetical protein
MDNKKTLAAVLGAAAGFTASRAIDLALVGGGVATAASAVGFAGYMMLAGNHEPHINGMEYLAIFAQPSGHAARGADAADATKVDTRPVGAIPREIKDNVAGYSLVGAQAEFAWLREGNRIFSVRPGQEVPRLGRVAAIVERDGRWTLVNSKGEELLVSGQPELSPSASGKFDKRMIFGDGTE